MTVLLRVALVVLVAMADLLTVASAADVPAAVAASAAADLVEEGSNNIKSTRTRVLFYISERVSSFISGNLK